MKKIIQHTIFGEEETVAAPKKNRSEVFNDYEGFTEKFEPKKTTDDCYTPPEVYECILGWVRRNIDPLDGVRIRRPFYPGGDYQREAEGYTEEDVVVDNPPFSILSKIVDFYTAHGIRFFLFGPALTLFGAPRPGVTYIVADAHIIYENGADVTTGFLTNMEGKHRVWVAGDLAQEVAKVVDELKRRKTKPQRKIIYPTHLITAALLGKVAKRGVSFKVRMDECEFVRKLDNFREALYGGGYLLSERAAAERAAAERAAAERAAAERAAAERAAAERAALSERELRIISRLSGSES